MQVKQYRRGAILGLTMAEVMMLLIFCIIVTFAVLNEMTIQPLISDKGKDWSELVDASLFKQRISELEAENRKLKNELQAFKDKESERIGREASNLAKLKSDYNKLKEDWEELKIENEELIEAKKQLDENWEELKSQFDDLMEKKRELDENWKELTSDHEELKERYSQLKAEMNEMKQKLKDLEKGGDAEHNWPPIINLSDKVNEFLFSVGSAQISESFEMQLVNEIVDDVVDRVEKYDADVVEVIGHTDEQPVSDKNTNLDEMLIRVITGKAEPSELKFADNSGLGMARALSVAKVLQDSGELDHLTILPLSGAQLIIPHDKLSSGQPGDIETRRRIEIRVRRHHEVENLIEER